MSALLESLLERGESLDAERRAAAMRVAHTGLPSARTEAWKYTSLRALEQRRYANGDADASTRPVDIAPFRLPGVEGARVVFVNGVLRGDLSDLLSEAGLTITAWTAETPVDLSESNDDDAAAAFANLNTALATDGPILRVADDARIERPVHLVFVGAPASNEIAWHARAVIAVGARASLTLVEHHVGAGNDGASQLGNLVARYALGEGAKLDLVQIQHAADTTALIRRSEFKLAAGAELSMHTIETGAQLSRHDLIVDLAGTGARFASHGVFAMRGRQHVDTHLDVRHSARDTISDIVWRGVADQRSRGVFHGAITVAEGADGADAQLSNKNLLLSPNAEIDTQPVLEIYADEVKAAHGATVGQLDEAALFYLRSRGLAPDAARSLLILAFCNAMLSDLEPPLRAHLEASLAARLPRSTED